MAMVGCAAATSSMSITTLLLPSASSAAPSSSSSFSQAPHDSVRPIKSPLSPLLHPAASSSSSFTGAPRSLRLCWPPSQVCRSTPPIRMMLPSQDPERVASANRPKWSARAIKSFSMAELEARKLKYPNTGTEALLMGMLTEGTSQAARYLRAHGITLFGVREETIKLLGKADMYFFSPEHPPLTEPAQKALDWAVDENQKSGSKGEVTTTHLLLGIWAQKGSAGQQVLAALGFDEKNAKELQETLKQPVSIG